MLLPRMYPDKNGCNNINFVKEWPFASELLLYVEHTYGTVWGIYTCSQIGPGAYLARFRAKDERDNYQYRNVRINFSKDPEIGWVFSPV